MMHAVLFAVISSTGGALCAEETIADRRARLAKMTPAKKEELQRKKERYDNLTYEEKLRLRQLHEQLSCHRDAGRLRKIMIRYNDWLKSLSPSQRVELAELSGQERIAKIKQFMQEQESQRFSQLVKTRLGQEDVRTIFAWLHEYAQRHERELLSRLSDEARKRVLQETDPKKRWPLLLHAFQRRRPGGNPISPDANEIAELREGLSAEAQKALDSVPDQQKQMLIQFWIRAAVMSRWMVSEEELMEFFAKKLTSQQRESLESLPRDQLQRELRRMYYQHRFGRPGGGDRRGRFPKWPGPHGKMRPGPHGEHRGPPKTVPGGRPPGTGGGRRPPNETGPEDRPASMS